MIDSVLRPLLHVLVKQRVLILALVGSVATALASDGAARWWKGNLHTHTLWSDGDDFPETVADWYRTHGYEFLALSDHNVLSRGERWMDLKNIVARAKGKPAPGEPDVAAVDPFEKYLKRFGTNWVQTRPSPLNRETQVRLMPLDEVRAHFESPGRFLMIEAEEITHEAKNGRAIHIGAVNILEAIKPLDGATVREVIADNLRAVEEAAARQGRRVLVHVNHPNYKWGVTAEDLAAIVDERFFEVWNGVDGDNDPGDKDHPSTDEIWDIANALRLAGLRAPPLYAVATDDSHDYHGTKWRALPGRAWVMVRAKHLTPESLIRAMQAGDFYATTGVLLKEVQFDASAGKLSLSIQAQTGETFVTRFIGTRRGVSLKGQPRLDKDGRVVETTLDYRTASGPQIGEVLREEAGINPCYQLNGDELYVRAVVTCSGRPDVPSTEFGFQRAWTQPVGWQLEGSNSK